VIAELHQKNDTVLAFEDEIAVKDAALLELRKAIEGIHIKDGKSKAVSASLAKELIDARVAATVSQRRASKAEREKVAAPSAAVGLVSEDEGAVSVRPQSQPPHGASHECAVCILHAALDIRAAVSMACKAIGGQYSSGAVQAHNARSLVKKLDASSVSQELRALSQLLRRDFHTLCQVIGVDYVRTDSSASCVPSISDSAELIVKNEECIAYLRRQLSDLAAASKVVHAEVPVKPEPLHTARMASITTKNLKGASEASTKQTEELKASLSRLKVELGEREKECSALLSRAVDAEAACDLLRAEMSKVSQLKKSSAGQHSVDLTMRELSPSFVRL
jgi:hypothetical protein